MEITKDLSNRFRLVSGISMLMVVFIHARFIHSRWDTITNCEGWTGKFSFYLQFLLSENICRLAVPLFFMISGFWLARNNDGSLKAYGSSVKKRLLSICVPYLIVSGLWLVVYNVISGSIPSLYEVFYSWVIEPVPYQLWFLQYLMLCVVCSWILLKLIDRYPISFLGLLTLLYFVEGKIWGGFSEAFLFFGIGILMAKKRIVKFTNIETVFVSILYFTALAAVVYIGNFLSMLPVYLYKIEILCGVALVMQWILYSKYDVTSDFKMPSAALCFWIYIFHEPIQSFVKTMASRFLSSQISVCIAYVLIPSFVICICTIAYKITPPHLLKYITRR